MWTDALPNLLIGLREGLEAGLIVSILVAAVVRAERRDALTPMWLGVAGALALSLAFGAVLTFAAADLSTTAQETLGGVLSLFAVGLVTTMVFWMRRTARTLRPELTGKVSAALAIGTGMVTLTAFLAVGREGLEAALFLWSTTRTAGESVGPLIGALVGITIATALCWGLYRQALRINLASFFTWTGASLIVIAAGVVGYGLRDLQEGGVIGGAEHFAFDLTTHIDPSSWYARVVEGVLNLTPQMTAVQVIGYLVYLIPVMALFCWSTIGARARKPATTTASSLPTTAAPAASPAAAEPAPRAAPPPVTSREWPRNHRRVVLAGSLVVAPALLTVVAIVALGPKPSASAGTITVAKGSCAKGWKAPESGRPTFAIHNAMDHAVEVRLVGPDRTTIYGEIETLGPGTTRDLSVTVGPGRYLWACLADDGATTYSTIDEINGQQVAGAHAYVPVTEDQLQTAADEYRKQVSAGLQTLAADTDQLAALVRAGNFAAAKQQWLRAHLDYTRLGAAYGTFGDFNDKIDGRPDGLPNGENDPDFTGFLRLEYGLWHGQRAVELTPIADQLDADVHGLVADFPNQEINPADLPVRTHEILENTLQFEFTGQTDMGSHTNLATASANVAGTRTVLGTIAPLLQPRAPQVLAESQAGIDGLAALLASYRHADGTWTPLDALNRPQRQRLNADIGDLVETLAPIPDLLEVPASGGGVPGAGAPAVPTPTTSN